MMPVHQDIPAIRVEGVGKCYHLFENPFGLIRHALFPFGGKKTEDFWALRNVSFEIQRGETFGVVGRNGSGKSTLLQLIAGTLTPSEGTVAVNGRVAALLELGSGFNPNFTGLENIYLNGAILGLGRAEIDTRMDDILSFADIGDFVKHPVKTYSSGMFVRLAFAVQICLDPDIMIVDEALAVGDIFFRQKCYARLQKLKDNGCSIMLVSHATTEVEQFCDRALLLDHGSMRFLGTAAETIKHYYLAMQNKLPEVTPVIASSESSETVAQAFSSNDSHDFWPDDSFFSEIGNQAQVTDDTAHCLRYLLCDAGGRPCNSFEQGQEALFFCEFKVHAAIGVPLVGTVIRDDKGIIVHGKGSLEYGAHAPTKVQPGTAIRSVQKIELCLAPGEYSFELGFATVAEEYYANLSRIDHNQLFSNIVRLCHIPQAGTFCVTLRHSHEGPQLTHHGVADLPGTFTFIGEMR